MKIAIRSDKCFGVAGMREKCFGIAGVAGDRGLSRAIVVCLSVTIRTSPGSLIQSRRNFRWQSGSWSGTFI